MNISLAFIRIFFAIISIFFMTTHMLSPPEGVIGVKALIGIVIGLVFSLLLFGFDILFRRFNLRSFNIAVIGLFIGYLMGQALVIIFHAILNLSSIPNLLKPQVLEIIKTALFLFGTYLGAIMTLRTSNELYISIPFVKFAPTTQKKRDLLIDTSVLCDTRIIDFCSTGVLDKHLVLPRFVVKELHAQMEGVDETNKKRARRCLDVIKQMEGLPHLSLRFNDTDFPETKEMTGKFVRLARLIDANVLTADIGRIQTSSVEDVRFINLHSLSNALKPLMETGEFIKIKVQRYGKEPRQGVGYLDDGTMVVVNGGGNFIGEIVQTQVLSVKHTSSGRMIFCNLLEKEGMEGRPSKPNGNGKTNGKWENDKE